VGRKLWLVFVIACRGEPTPSQPAVPDCAAAVNGVIDHLSVLEEKSFDSMPADSILRRNLDTPEALARHRKQQHDEAECAKRAITKTCIDDAWSEPARACMFRANDLPECVDAFTATQKEHIEHAAAPCEHHEPEAL